MVTYTGVTGGLLLLGSYIFGVHLGQPPTTFLWLGSPVLIYVGLGLMRPQPEYARPTFSAAPQSYTRKETTVYGDARSANDFEVHESLRDKSGGFDPMFKD